MSWKDLLEPENNEITLPWYGGKTVQSMTRTWTIKGRRPPAHGWFRFDAVGRQAHFKGEGEPAYDFTDKPLVGYIIGNRFVSRDAGIDPRPDAWTAKTEQVYCVPDGLEFITRAHVVRMLDGRLVFLQPLWDEGPEQEVIQAFENREENVDGIQGVTPALELSFRWISLQRTRAEEREQERERERMLRLAQEERRRVIAEMNRTLGTAEGRREMAKTNFDEAARAALRVSNAEFVSSRDGVEAGTKIVRYLYDGHRLQCICDLDMRIVEAGVCLDDHRGTKGDTRFTLESLPAVIQEAIDQNVLVIYRHGRY